MDEEGLRKLKLVRAPGLHISARARIQGIRPEMVLGLIILSGLCSGTGIKALITSVLDGEHMVSSLHYSGDAADFISDLTEDRDEWVAELAARLGPDFDVVDEGTHIHIEYQPHVGAVT